MKKVSLTLSLFITILHATAQNVGIGTTNPTQKLDVNGTIKTTGFQMSTGASAGKILKTDTSGVASWGIIDGKSLFATPPAVDLSCPAVTGSVNTGIFPYSVAVAGNYAYVVSSTTNTMKVIDISNPAAPVVKGSVITGNYPRSVAVAGTFAYVVNYSNHTMKVINISNHAAPVIVGSIGTSNNPNSVAVAGNYAYVANYGADNMEIFDISNPAVITLKGSVFTNSGPFSVFIADSFAYVVNTGANTMQVINITNPASPVVVGTISTQNNPNAVAVAGNYAYVVNKGSNTLQVFNISNPAAPVLAGSVSTGTFPWSVAVAGSYAYVVNYVSATMLVVNISNPLLPVVAGSVSTGVGPISVAIAGTYAYVVNTDAGMMQVINLTCSQNFTAGYNPANGQTNPVEIQWIKNGNDISNSNFGNVGVGTKTPASKLDVKGSLAVGAAYSGTVAAPANGAIIEGRVGIGTTTPVSKLDVGGSLAVGATYSGTFAAPTNGAIIEGRVGIGTSNPDAPLQINGTSITTPNLIRSFFQQSNLTSITNGTSTSGNIQVHANGWYWADGGGFVATSDARIKNIIGLSNTAADLVTLNKIEVTNYKYKDEISHGSGLQKKVIAQQLQLVYPTAVNTNKGIIPNIFEKALIVEAVGRQTHITTAKPHGLFTGDRVKLILENSGEKIVKIGVVDANTFSVNETIDGNVFVYGKQVDDLLSVDYDAIGMLNVAATQELSKQVRELQKENALLKANADQQKSTYEARLKAIEDKLKALPAAVLTTRNE
ncbi:MAG: beta-propeller fold lactonase family protein [Chitinophagaceae bacterium]